MPTFTLIFSVKQCFDSWFSLNVKNSIPIHEVRKLGFQVLFTKPFIAQITTVNPLLRRIPLLNVAFMANT